MIIGVLGKGGSGKSTISYRLIKHLSDKGAKVLAVDADHNMDLTYNLGVKEEFNYMGGAQNDIRLSSGIDINDAPSAVALLENTPIFTINPKDEFTNKYTYLIDDNISLMTAGPHTDDQLYGQACSHWLTTAIKTYLPYLELNNGEYCVVDERAGVDGVGTGMTIGWNVALIVAEATEHGIKAANQIAKMVKFFGTPYEFALNKVRENDDLEKLNSLLEKPAKYVFYFNEGVTRKEDQTPVHFSNVLSRITEDLDLNRKAIDDRKQRAKKKVLENLDYKNNKKQL